VNIVQVIPYMHTRAGGPPVVVDRLSRELVKRGHGVTVVTTDLYANGETDWASTPRPYQLQVHSRWAGNGYGISGRLMKGLQAAAEQADILHLHTLWSFMTVATAKAGFSTGRPSLVMPHGMLDPHSLERRRWKKQLFGKLIEFPLLRRMNGICFTHLEEERLARESCRGLPPGSIIELGADDAPSDLAGLREQFLSGHPDLRGRFVILFLGRLHSKKGLDLLIPAFVELSRVRPNARLLLVGPGDSGYVDSLKAAIGAAGIKDKVTFTGALNGEAKWGAMAASDLFVLPSYQENFALTVVDAIRAGLPVVLSHRVNLWSDVVEAGAARVCELDAGSLCETLRDSLDDAAWRASAKLQGVEMLKTRFDWGRSAQVLEGVYERTVELFHGSEIRTEVTETTAVREVR
jgi:glycosyltransferase involved in cell wall biosynthesis